MATFKQLEEHAIVVILKGMVLIVFWVACWGLLDNLIEQLEEKTGLSPMKAYSLLLGGVIALFLAFPSLLEKL